MYSHPGIAGSIATRARLPHLPDRLSVSCYCRFDQDRWNFTSVIFCDTHFCLRCGKLRAQY
jgi:hypothetical protein